jgi:hypothetical protein
MEEQRTILRTHGYIPNQKGSMKALRKILERLERRHPDLEFARTPGGEIAASGEALGPLALVEPFVKALLAFRGAEKLHSSFLDKMGKPILHPSFDVLKTTGRTSSFGDLNAQNLPRDDRIRSCIVPSAGHVFIDADYAAIEMATLAQAVQEQFGLESKLAMALNAGKDPHRMVAALATGKPEGDVTKGERQRAKPINFGKPGAMGNSSLQDYARTSYGVELTNAEVEELSDAWFALFPEMRDFLRQDGDLGGEIARLFGLTPLAYFEQTESRSFLDHPDNAGRGHHPNPALGGMCMKALKEPVPQTRAGRPYHPKELDFFWNQVEARLDVLPSRFHKAVRQRHPSCGLQRAAMGLVGRAPVFTLTGRLRARATYAARHNNIFQGLAADGAKLGLWKIWRAGYRIVNFIHDELLVEVPSGPDYASVAANIETLMIEGMKEVVPDVRVAVESVATTVWNKGAKRVIKDGRLEAWSPPAADSGDRV